MTRVVPVLRIFDEEKAKQFYVSFLGFEVDWEHRFEAGFPLYMQVTRGDSALHLTEHHGDCCPGGYVRIETGDLARYHEELIAKAYTYARPSIETTPWNTREVTVHDPFGNKLVFYMTI